jgi:hypothetical protein
VSVDKNSLEKPIPSLPIGLLAVVMSPVQAAKLNDHDPRNTPLS